MKKIDKLNLLFDLWKKAHKEDNNYENNTQIIKSKDEEIIKRINRNSFCIDGFINNSKENSVLYILKESNLEYGTDSNDIGEYDNYF